MLSQVVVVNRNTELARACEVIDILSELPFRETEKGKSFELWKQEVKAWKIVV